MTQCTGITRKGVACQNKALQGLQPPRCRHHQQTPDDRKRPLTLATISEPRNLSAELQLVRDVLGRLADRLDDPDYTMLPADLRTLAMLIFSGVRTVAYLLSQEESETDELQVWLDQTLNKLSADVAAEI